MTGTIPQWGVLIVVSLAFIKMVLPWRQQHITTMDGICSTLREEIKEVKDRLNDCEEQCKRRDETILGMKRQSTTQQISFARILMKALGREVPELAQMLSTLESLERDLEKPVLLGDSNAQD